MGTGRVFEESLNTCSRARFWPTTSIGSSSGDPGDAFFGPTSISSGEIDSSSRPRDDEGGMEDAI